MLLGVMCHMYLISCLSCFRDDDDINDVASMAGVNLNEESARILATNSELVGTQIRSCKDEAFLHPGLLHRRILETGENVRPHLSCTPGMFSAADRDCRPLRTEERNHNLVRLYATFSTTKHMCLLSSVSSMRLYSKCHH